MKLKILDEMPSWTTYLLAVIVVGVCIVATVVSFIWLQRLSHHPKTLRARITNAWPCLLPAVIGALAFWFFITSMFFRSHAVALGSDRVELIYFWPQPRTIIQMTDLKRVKLFLLFAGEGTWNLPRERTFFAVLVLDKPRLLWRSRRH